MKQQLLFILLSVTGYAQNRPDQLVCGTSAPTLAQVNQLEQVYRDVARNPKQARRAAGTLYFPVRFLLIRKADGSGGENYETVNAGLAQLNGYFTPAGIQFYIAPDGLIEVKNDQLFDINTSEMRAEMYSLMKTDAINIFLINTGRDNVNPTFAGQAPLPSTSKNDNWIVVQWRFLTNRITFPHEMGHYLGLYHPHDNPTGGARELVDGSNCSTAGDYVCDTPADPFDLVRVPVGAQPSTCQYTYDIKDANGQLYRPLLNNIMAYWFCAPFSFTNGQYERMKTVGIAGRTNPLNQYSLNAPATNVVAPQLSVSSTSVGSPRLAWQDKSNNETGFIIERSVNSADNFVAVGGVAPNVTQWTDNIDNAGIAYYRIRASNALTYSNVESGKPGYCLPAHRDIWSCTSAEGTIGLESVTIWSAEKASVLLASKGVCSQNGNAYSDLTNRPAVKLTAGVAYPFQVEAMRVQAGQSTGGIYPTRVNIWIDLNQDQAFSDDERLFVSPLKWNSTITALSGDYPNPFLENKFTIPTTAKSGPTRLRIRAGTPVFTGGIETPCEQIDGETEDYLVEITNNTCQLSANISGNLAVCQGNSTTLTATASGGQGNVTYVWKSTPNGTGTNTSTLTVNATGVYSVTATDSRGCTASSSGNVTIKPLPVAVISVTEGALNLLPNTRVTLSANTGSALLYQWNLDGVAIPGANASTYQTQKAGVYTVAVSKDGCTAVSGEVSVNLITAVEPLKAAGMSVMVSPNPAPRQTQVILQLTKAAVATLQLTDAGGRELQSWQFKVSAHEHRAMLNLTASPPGVYFLRAEADGQQIVKKIVNE